MSRDSGTVNAAPQGDKGSRAEREGESLLALKSFSLSSGLANGKDEKRMRKIFWYCAHVSVYLCGIFSC